MRMAHWEEVMKHATVKGKMDSVPMDKLSDYAAADADATCGCMIICPMSLIKRKMRN
jgi:hypothetical protein